MHGKMRRSASTTWPTPLVFLCLLLLPSTSSGKIETKRRVVEGQNANHHRPPGPHDNPGPHHKPLGPHDAAPTTKSSKHRGKRSRSGRRSNARALHDEGTALYKAGRFADAASMYRECIEVDPKGCGANARSHYNLGSSLDAIQRGSDKHASESLDAYAHALRIDPRYTNAWCVRMHVQLPCWHRLADSNSSSVKGRSDGDKPWR
eukprot:SAG11_NODE_109_length_16381_cov_48.316546_9_plen_205_part_00